MVLQALSAVTGIEFIVRHDNHYRSGLLLLLLAAPLLAGCAGGSMSDMFSSDLLSKDADWFSKPGRVFVRNVSIESPPLTPDKPVSPADLISADGACPGMAPAPNALADGAAGAPAQSGIVALGHTECDVARGAGSPDSVNLSTNARGDRVAVLTYSRGGRAGIYTFTAGRLTMVERGPEAAPQPKAARPKKRAAT
jgi:hypothetical protein